MLIHLSTHLSFTIFNLYLNPFNMFFPTILPDNLKPIPKHPRKLSYFDFQTA